MKTFSQYIAILNSDNSRLFKEAKIKEFGTECPQFVRLLERAYSPEFVYGVKKVPAVTKSGNKTLQDLWLSFEMCLVDLTSRKITGNKARDEVVAIMEQLTPEETEVFANVLKGDLRCNVNRSSINKMFPGTIPEYPYMRCSLMKGSNIDKFDWSKGIFSQEKADGMYANVFVKEDGSVSITSRAGTLFANVEFKSFIDEFLGKADKGFCYNGELLVLQKDSEDDGWQVLPREIGNGILNSVLKGGVFEKNQCPFYYIWDKVPMADAVASGKYKRAYKDRYQDIKSLSGSQFHPIPTKIVYSLEEAFQHYTELTSRGIEGTVIKNPNGIWADGTSKDQIKLKVEAEVDLIVRGFNPGNGKNEKWFGSIICESSDGKIQVNVSGFTDKDRERINKEKAQWIDSKIITVKANSIMKNDSGASRLFLPRFAEERLDKDTADSYEKIVQIFAEAMGVK